MKNFFKIVTMALVGVFGYNANAQDSGFAVKVGLNLNTITKSEGAKSNVGFNFGATYELPIAEGFSAESGLFFDTRGAKAGDLKLVVYGLTLPVTAKYRVEVADGTNVVVNAGPFVNIGLFGKISETKIEFGNEGLNRFNTGVTLGVGVEVDNYIFGFGYDLGLTKIDKESESDSKFNAFKIGVGYKF